jgi:tetratricopeptide (TPR) repeat protein
MKKTRFFAVCAVLGAAAAIAVAGTQGRLAGTVTGADGAPLEGVTVTVTTPNISTFKMTVKTDRKGQYGLIVNDATIPYQIRFEKEGFAPFEQSKKLSTVEVTTVNATLQPPAAAAGGRPAAPSPSDQAALSYNAGVDLLNGGDKAGAETKFLEATSKNPDLPQAWQALTILAYQKKDWAKVLEYGRKATELDPAQTSLYQMMAAAAQQSGDKKAAAEWQAKYEEANPETPEALYNKGIESYNKKNMKDAETQLAKAVEVKPDFALAHFWLGMTTFNLNKKAAAREHLQKYLDLEPDGAEAATAKEILPLLK